ncbi:MAG: glyoxylate/hydroxypyruvate reductase A [Comamonas sp.]
MHPSSAPSPRPVLVVKSGGQQAVADWQKLFAEFSPALEVRGWDDPEVDPASVEYALVWQPQAGRLARYPRLRAVLSSSAGVDHILCDPLLPEALPIVRMVPEETQQRMAEFIGMSCLLLQKGFPQMLAQQRNRHWREIVATRLASEVRVGIMGLGALGAQAARYVRTLGFQVCGWSQTRKSISGVCSYAGAQELADFLAGTDILVCLLPDTQATRGIVDAALLAHLPRGASLINVGRGAHVVEPDLLAALDSGQLASAVLDVFEQEPLDAASAFWAHPQVIVTPHSAATPSRREKARQAAQAIAAMTRGEPPSHLLDRTRGY